jgi:predicted membrane-bound dolichyl-phosphate-mannose-protein mannosyltransferase
VRVESRVESDRQDLVVGWFALLALLALALGRPRVGYAVLAVGTAYKLVTALLLPVWQTRRNSLWFALLAMGVRTAFLALLGFPEPRYILELLPLTLVLGSIALTTPLRLGALLRAQPG